MTSNLHRWLLKLNVDVWNNFREWRDLSEVDFSEADLSWAFLSSRNLRNASLRGADLRHADLRGADLRGADLSYAHLSVADLRHADLRSATLKGTVLNMANLNMADLNHADLRSAILNSAYLSNTNLQHANLDSADLRGTHFNGTDLSKANLTRAAMFRTTFGGVDLRIVEGLTSVNHRGPSIIDIGTIYRSKGDIPREFLRGAGVPDTFIEFARSIAHAEQPIEYYSCFISYSSNDENLAQRLYNDLQDAGVRCWFAPEDMKIGDPMLHRIDESIRRYEKLLLILSENSIASEWVDHEVQVALAKERRTTGHVLFPIRKDQAVLESEKGWAATIKETRHIGNFTHWKDHGTYQAAFQRLLRDLKTTPQDE